MELFYAKGIRTLVVDTIALADGVTKRTLYQHFEGKKSKSETGITTSVVRYESGAIFSEHIHPRGEEIFVLEGEFADEFGLYPEKPL